MTAGEKVPDSGDQSAVNSATQPARQPLRRPVASAGARDRTSSADSPAAGPAGSADVAVTETAVSVLVVAPVLAVCRYLADIANIARGLPGVRSVHAGAAQTLIICHDGASERIARLAPGRFRIDPHRQQIEWEIHATERYSGTLTIHGDCTTSRLESTLSSDQPTLIGVARDVHRRMLRRIARAVEVGLDRLWIPPAHHDPTALLPAARQPSVTAHPEALATHNEAVLGRRGVVREYWGRDVPDSRS